MSQGVLDRSPPTEASVHAAAPAERPSCPQTSPSLTGWGLPLRRQLRAAARKDTHPLKGPGFPGRMDTLGCWAGGQPWLGPTSLAQEGPCGMSKQDDRAQGRARATQRAGTVHLPSDLGHSGPAGRRGYACPPAAQEAEAGGWKLEVLSQNEKHKGLSGMRLGVDLARPPGPQENQESSPQTAHGVCPGARVPLRVGGTVLGPRAAVTKQHTPGGEARQRRRAGRG